MVIPAGVYRSRTIIPPFQVASWIAVEIIGAGQPAPVYGATGCHQREVSPNNSPEGNVFKVLLDLC